MQNDSLELIIIREVAEKASRAAEVLRGISTRYSDAILPNDLSDFQTMEHSSELILGHSRSLLELYESKMPSGILGNLKALTQRLIPGYRNGQSNGLGAEERRAIHDINNYLTPVISYPEIFLETGQYKANEQLSRDLQASLDYGKRINYLLKLLNGIKPNGEQIYVDISSLTGPEKSYSVAHIDDDSVTRKLFAAALTEWSNLTQKKRGLFGHDGQPVRYKVKSYSSVDEALAGIGNGEIDLLVTDREMPGKTGNDLLNAITTEQDRTKLKLEFGNVKNVAMLTGGIGKNEMNHIMQTYKIPVIDKPFTALGLENQVYSAINKSQS